MAYASVNFKSKKALKEAVAAGQLVTVWHPGMGKPNPNGANLLEGPWYPEPHRWYAEVSCVNGKIVKVK